jgi:hypothetical protein
VTIDEVWFYVFLCGTAMVLVIESAVVAFV